MRNRGTALLGLPILRLPVLWLLALGLVAPAAAQDFYQGLPAPLQRVAFDQRLGEQIDLSLPFLDEHGANVVLGDLMSERPVVLALVYHDCPMLCSMTLNGLVSSLKALELDAGREFDVLIVSFDPEDTPDMARAAKARAVASYTAAGTGRDGNGARGWHSLTGEAASIDALTESVGFSYTLDEETGEYAHAAGIVVLTPGGLISRYLMGIEFPARSLRLALVESAEQKIGTLVDQALLFCYQYDPETGTYSAATMNLVRLGGALTVIFLIVFVLRMLRREKRGMAAMGEPKHVA